MKNSNKAQQYLNHAVGDFNLAGKVSKKIPYELLCFHAQQAAEKSLKAIFIKIDKPFPHTHNLERLLLLLSEEGINIPPVIQKAKLLTNYATDTRYPGDYDPISKNEYKQALSLAEKVLNWAKSIIEDKNGKLF